MFGWINGCYIWYRNEIEISRQKRGENIRIRNRDLRNYNVGFLKVIRKNEEDKRQGTYWLCECSCPECTKRRIPKLVSIRQDKLLEGRTKSCGYNKDLQETRGAKNTNKFEVNQDYCVGYTYKGEKFYFDTSDYDLVTGVSTCWHFNDSGYVTARDMRESSGRYQTTGRRRIVYLKDIVMGKQKGEQVKYVNYTAKNDNRKSNLMKVCGGKEIERK